MKKSQQVKEEKQPLLVQYPLQTYDKLKAYSGSHGTPMTQTVIMATDMFVDALIKTEMDQEALSINDRP